MKEALTAYPKVSAETPGRRKSFPVYQAAWSGILVPKFYLRSIGGIQPTSSIEPKLDKTSALKFVGELQPDQKKGVRQALAILKLEHGVFLQGRCGSGKTVIGTFLISKIPGKQAVVLVDQTEIAAQWAEQIQTHLPDATISFVMPLDDQRAICKKLGLSMEGREHIDFKGRIVVVMAETLMRIPIGEPIQATPLIVDEAHTFSAERFSSTIYHFNFRYSIALTASERRADRLEWIFQSLLGTSVAVLKGRRNQAVVLAMDAPTNPITKDEHRLYFCKQYRKVVCPWKCAQVCHPTAPCVYMIGEGQKIDFSSVWQRVTNDDSYNRWLTEIVVSLHAYGRQTVVFGKYKAHLRQLRKMAIEAGIPESHTSLYFAGMDKVKCTTPQITFATYGKMQKAIDLPHKDAALFAIPIRDAQQPMGRIERFLPGKIQTVLLEPVLSNVEPLAGIFLGHCSFYRKESYVVSRTDSQGARGWLAACQQAHQGTACGGPGQ